MKNNNALLEISKDILKALSDELQKLGISGYCKLYKDKGKLVLSSVYQSFIVDGENLEIKGITTEEYINKINNKKDEIVKLLNDVYSDFTSKSECDISKIVFCVPNFDTVSISYTGVKDAITISLY